MAKSDLLKEAIADARAVKETALANAKIALQEVFAPRIESMLAQKMREELEDEELPEDGNMDLDNMDSTEELPADDFSAPESVGVGLDFNDDGEYDLSGTLGAAEEDELAPGDEENMNPEENPEDEYNEGYDNDTNNLELESIIRELESDLDDTQSENDETDWDPEHKTPDGSDIDAEMYNHDVYAENPEEDIDEIIEAILREVDGEEPMEGDDSEKVAELEERLADADKDLQEAYNTVKQLKSIINEVNLLNAKLLYTNKLFRNFDLNESQKMKVLENFDRAGTTREVKLVFSTIAESLKTPTKKRVVKESYASKPTASTKPTTTILSEGFEMADRWKKLAGLSK